MEADLMVNAQGIQEIIDSLTSGLTDIAKDFDEIRHAHATLGASWKGGASDAALSKLTGLEGEGDSHSEVLQNTVKALQEALQGYNQAEDAVSELWSL